MKLLLVDDDRQLVETLATAFRLQRPHWQILTASDADDGLSLFTDHVPDLVLLDVALPGMNGFDLLRTIRRASDVPVIMLTARADEICQVRGLELGADGYVVKPCSLNVLLARAVALMRRSNSQPLPGDAPDITVGPFVCSRREERAYFQGRPLKLTPGEYRLLAQFVDTPGRLLPFEMLLSRLWTARGADGSLIALRSVVNRLRRKLRASCGDASVIGTVRGMGYQFRWPTAAALEPSMPTST
jgi:DNA-binding response OmpR family regulator